MCKHRLVVNGATIDRMAMLFGLLVVSFIRPITGTKKRKGSITAKCSPSPSKILHTKSPITVNFLSFFLFAFVVCQSAALQQGPSKRALKNGFVDQYIMPFLRLGREAFKRVHQSFGLFWIFFLLPSISLSYFRRAEWDFLGVRTDGVLGGM